LGSGFVFRASSEKCKVPGLGVRVYNHNGIDVVLLPRPTPEAPSQPPPPLPPVACLLSPPPPLSPLPSPPPSSPPPSSSSRHGSTPTLRTSHTRISPPAVELSSNEGGGGAHEVSGDSEALCLPPSPNSRQHVTVSLCPTHRANTRSQPPSRGVGGSRRPRGGSPMTASD
jgi:hypothetical protein